MNRVALLFKEILHPKKCCACGKIIDENESLCDYCHEMLVRCDPIKRCTACGLDKKNCQCKRQAFAFSGCVAPFFNTGVAQMAVYGFKFRRKMAGAEFLSRQMALCVKNEYRDIKFDGVCFVPMNLRKKIRRGYNQSELLAEQISKILDLPLYNPLICKRKGASQHTLSEKERFKNVEGLYSATPLARGKTLLLVDDIKTTGATLNECAKQLLKSGAARVFCVTALIAAKNSNNTGKVHK